MEKKNNYRIEFKVCTLGNLDRVDGVFTTSDKDFLLEMISSLGANPCASRYTIYANDRVILDGAIDRDDYENVKCTLKTMFA